MNVMDANARKRVSLNELYSNLLFMLNSRERERTKKNGKNKPLAESEGFEPSIQI